MNSDQLVNRAQVYRFLTEAFLYPRENWLEDLPDLEPILEGLDFRLPAPVPTYMDLEVLQADYRRTLGLSGSIPYETEIGLPDEYRQSQEMADIAGFYRAFGFQVGGVVRERPDYLAAELEFMSLLALKETLAAANGNPEGAEVCGKAAITFLSDHLGRWIGLFSAGLAKASGADPDGLPSDRPYLWLARLAADFVRAHAARLGVELKPVLMGAAIPTPLGPELSCGDCPAAG